MDVNPPRERPIASRLGFAADFLSFDPAPCVDAHGRNDLRVDIGGRLVPGTGGVLMRADHGAVHTHCPFRPLGLVGVAAELVEQPFPRTVG